MLGVFRCEFLMAINPPLFRVCLGGDRRLSQPYLEVTHGDSKSFVDVTDGFGEAVIISPDGIATIICSWKF